MYQPPVDPAPSDPKRAKRLNRSEALRHTVALAEATARTGGSREGFTADQIVEYAATLAAYLDGDEA